MKFYVLSFNGGGLRGVSSLAIATAIEDKLNIKIADKFKLVAGTSTGGLIACATGIGKSAKETLDIYLNRGGEIFPHGGKIKQKFDEVNNILHPKYSADGINKVLNDILGDKKMSDLKTDVLIPSYDLNSSNPLFFKSRNKSIYDYKLFDICRATSSAPTYLPSYPFLGFDCIDGGIFCNNPTLSAVAELIKHKYAYGFSGNINDLIVLNIGTGTYKQTISVSDAQNKGELFWAQKAPDLMMSGVDATTDYIMQQVIPNYMRLNICIDDEKYAEMDNSDTEILNHIIELTNKQIINTPKLDEVIKFLS